MGNYYLDQWPVVGDIRRAVKGAKAKRKVWNWRRKGSPVPPPHPIKQSVLREHAKKYDCRLLVETGTLVGEMVEAMRRDFDRVYSIELSDKLYADACRRFRACKNVELIHGDSGVELGKLLPKLNQRTLFWLDGHWSSGVTAKGEKETPIAEELGHVMPMIDQGHIVLIDDARLFGVDTDYPPLDVIEDYIRTEVKGIDFRVEDDIIRITPTASSARAAA